jgi:hypothetical protein
LVAAVKAGRDVFVGKVREELPSQPSERFGFPAIPLQLDCSHIFEWQPVRGCHPNDAAIRQKVAKRL